jgi:methylmalonyl-CoA mutase N-terminal domain/subunit
VVKIRDKEIRTALTTKSPLRHDHPQGRLPQYEDHGEILKWLMLDNVPGSYPYTAGTFAFKREGEDPTRMFAGEGDAFRTNKRFKLLSQACRPSACPPPSTRSRCTATTRPAARTSTARWATPACRSPRWTT